MADPTPPKVHRLSGATYQPRFEYGDQAQVAALVGPDDGTTLGAGYVRMTGASIPWTIKYDEVILVIEGALTVETDAGVLSAGPGDTIWLPAGTRLTYVAEDALVFYAIQPNQW